MICTECLHEVGSLYTYYSQDNIRATTCPSCSNFADKYIENDPVLVGIDLILLRPQAIRHLIFNVLMARRELSLFTRVWRKLLVLTLFDVYIMWALAELSGTLIVDRKNQAILTYARYLLASVTKFGIVHVCPQVFVRILAPQISPVQVFFAMYLASYAKLLPLLSLIWNYENRQMLLGLVWPIKGIVLNEILAVSYKVGYTRAIPITFLSLGLSYYLNYLWGVPV